MDFALVLHAHLPYVKPAGHEILEERWLYEAVAETYLPLIWSLERLARDGVPVRLALSLSSTLMAMLADEAIMARCRRHFARTVDLTQQEVRRHAGTPLEGPARFYHERYEVLADDLDRRHGDLLRTLAELEHKGVLELFTTAGTHGYLPLLATDRGRFAQIEAGLQEFERHFGHRPAGLWLPECAYAPGIDHLLAAADIKWFVAEDSTVSAAWPPADPACVLTPAGVAAFARDMAASGQVWDSKAGYPGDPVYREFYRDQGYDLPLEAIGPWLVDQAVRSDTGLKYYRVTGPGTHKEPYDPDAARDRAREHARHYAGYLARRPGLVTAPFDAELLGHWWFEGPVWLEALFRELAAAEGAVCAKTPTDYLRGAPEPPLVRVPTGSWGRGGDHRFWLNPSNDTYWPRLHAAELQMVRAASADGSPPPVLNQCARELLLAQSSDWPFIMAGETTVAYAERRIQQHLDRFESLAAGKLAPESIAREGEIFPDIDARTLYGRSAVDHQPERPLQILMLSWEFPPGNVGGLGRHVFDLGEAMVAAGHTVHVITLADDSTDASFSRTAGMAVHRIGRPPQTGNFLSWVYRYNVDMVREAVRVASVYGQFDLVHGHDWLVGQAGMGLKARWRVPLIATLHATEKGRNNGIHDPLQDAIHAEEWHLAAAADRVITVSHAMAREVEESFRVIPATIYNGMNPPAPAGPPLMDVGVPYLFLIGRLVMEKGVHLAIRALPKLEQRVHLVIAGKGPMEGELRELAWICHVSDRVHFLGRISDAEKDAWLQNARAGLVPSLYEPFGITALEIMAAGTPAVVADTGGLAEIVTHGADGLKFAPGDVDQLCDALRRLLSDAALASALSAAGRRTVRERFAWPAIAEQTLEIYRASLREHVPATA